MTPRGRGRRAADPATDRVRDHGREPGRFTAPTAMVRAPARTDVAVTCLGLTFENDAKRLDHFSRLLRRGLEELHTKLGGVPFTNVDRVASLMSTIEHWPMGDDTRLRALADRMNMTDDPAKDLLQRWKDEVGFPHGQISDILALSDPPYYTACPNPFLGTFARAYGKIYDPSVPYRRKPFAVDVREGKSHKIYQAHGYHTKVPHLAIVPSILHYTKPNDLVLDGFAGSGMTGVAAQWCETAPTGYRNKIETTWLQSGFNSPCWGPRHVILNDLSPIASFIAANYNRSFDVDAFNEAGRTLLSEVKTDIGWMYETLHSDGKTKGSITYTVWSEVFYCPECTSELAFLDVALDHETGRVLENFPCPTCDVSLKKEKLVRVFETYADSATGGLSRRPTFRPSLIRYTVNRQTFEKAPDAHDHAILRKIGQRAFPSEIPTNRLPIGEMYHGSRLAPKGIEYAHHFFLPRPAHALATLWRQASNYPEPRIRHMLLYLVEQAIPTFSLLNRYRPNRSGQANQVLSGVYYIPSQLAETSVNYRFGMKFDRMVAAFKSLSRNTARSCITTGNVAHATTLPNDSIDYIFTDPPFGENIYYADLNLLVESWHRVLTNVKTEAVIDAFKNKYLADYQMLMRRSFKEYRRVLKPGRWITVVFHNSRNAVWTAIQQAMLESGFVVADVRSLDKVQGSYRQVTSTAVKQDLVISAYKPNGGLEERFALDPGTEQGAWDFVSAHLDQLPVCVLRDDRLEIVNERLAHVLFDRMVGFHVLRGATVPLSASDFLVGLARRFPERDGMVFLPEQVAEYDRKRIAVREAAQLEIFVIDEAAAIQWLKWLLRRRPQTFQDIHPQFLKRIAGWHRHEKLPELTEVLQQNFLMYDGLAEVPSQIHAYLSTNFKDFRNLPKDDKRLRAKAKDRWYLPDPSKASDLEKIRERALLREFGEYKDSRRRRIARFRVEAMRAGFRKAWQEQDYDTILAVAKRIEAAVLHEDPKLLMWYDQAVTRSNREAL